ncbi:MBL fold metallo-hydrolase [Clostridium sediminicola]|uniref:MBL fold metallo-hydrolase n=1 Tax=Clostridium sediminicola TaxID=3114879 RepID=UPI0031F21520
MKLEKINKASHIIKSKTNTGVYVFKDKSALLIDTGYDEANEEQINNILKENNLALKHIISTHAHADHEAGNEYFRKRYPELLIYTSKIEKAFIENKDLLSYALFNSAPPREIFKDYESDVVDSVLDIGINVINNEEFNIISLKGHSPGQIGVVTPDRVCYLADGLYSKKVLDTYFFPYTIDIAQSIETLHSINNIDADYFVLSHSKNIIPKDEIPSVVEKNLEHIDRFLDIIYNFLDQPLTKEQVTQKIIIPNHRPFGSKDNPFSNRHYFVIFLTVSAYLSYLYNTDKIDIYLENGMMYYKQR